MATRIAKLHRWGIATRSLYMQMFTEITFNKKLESSVSYRGKDNFLTNQMCSYSDHVYKKKKPQFLTKKKF